MDEKGVDLNALEPQVPDPIEGLRQENTFKTLGPKPKKVRRVGTVTLGLSLVTVGGLMIANMLVPGFPIYAIIRFSPVILIFIGIEILLSSIFNKGDKIRYDFLSMFISFFLIVGSFALSMAPNIYRNGVLRQQIQHTAVANMEEDIFNALEGEEISGIHTALYLEDYLDNGVELSADIPYSQLKGLVSYGSLDITLGESFADKADFSKKAKEILDKLEPLSLPLEEFYLSQEDGGIYLELDRRWQWGFSLEELENFVRAGGETGDARYDEGYQTGFADGQETVYQGQDEAFNEGYAEDYEQGRNDGYGQAYKEGYNVGYDEGIERVSPVEPTDPVRPEGDEER